MRRPWPINKTHLTTVTRSDEDLYCDEDNRIDDPNLQEESEDSDVDDHENVITVKVIQLSLKSFSFKALNHCIKTVQELPILFSMAKKFDTYEKQQQYLQRLHEDEYFDMTDEDVDDPFEGDDSEDDYIPSMSSSDSEQKEMATQKFKRNSAEPSTVDQVISSVVLWASRGSFSDSRKTVEQSSSRITKTTDHQSSKSSENTDHDGIELFVTSTEFQITWTAVTGKNLKKSKIACKILSTSSDQDIIK
ncbi:unnamed protein product [Diabrotica balteata]|uniref:Uncharacterized protein n=1 Tax=Diabrotica balteata TaxID=107213 RepID=A0A9N9X9R8_DIABA|nr:unnamed protein product [Diabrotica balteata]